MTNQIGLSTAGKLKQLNENGIDGLEVALPYAISVTDASIAVVEDDDCGVSNGWAVNTKAAGNLSFCRI